jgi:protein-L-isoaspartate(D-aspartate) O-methyltransferase
MARDKEVAAIRARYAADAMVWAREAGMDNPRVQAAFAAIQRERYLTPPPWRIFAPGGIMEDETSDPTKLYADVLIVLDRAKGINNGQPSLHAAWMAGVDPRPGEIVVQVGIGAGYYTALLAWLVGETGRVEAYEIEPRLAEIAAGNLAGLPQVRVHAESAIGIDLPAADIVYVSAGAVAPDPTWLRCLRPGGRLVMPWQPSSAEGRTLVVRRTPEGFGARLHASVSFVPCVGAGRRDAGPRGSPSRPISETRSVLFSGECRPDESATAIYEQIWFSAREPSSLML